MLVIRHLSRWRGAGKLYARTELSLALPIVLAHTALSSRVVLLAMCLGLSMVVVGLAAAAGELVTGSLAWPPLQLLAVGCGHACMQPGREAHSQGAEAGGARAGAHTHWAVRDICEAARCLQSRHAQCTTLCIILAVVALGTCAGAAAAAAGHAVAQ